MIRNVLILCSIFISQLVLCQSKDTSEHTIIFKDGTYLEPYISPFSEDDVIDQSSLLLQDHKEYEWENALIKQQLLLSLLMNKLDSMHTQQRWQASFYEHQIEQLSEEITQLQSKIKTIEQSTNGPALVDLNDNMTTLQEVPEEIRVYFNKERSEIDTEALMILNEIIDLLASSPQSGLLLTGCADDFTTESQNIILSQKRADEIRNMLISAGISPNRIIIRYIGSNEPQSMFRHQKVNIQFIKLP